MSTAGQECRIEGTLEKKMECSIIEIRYSAMGQVEKEIKYQ